MIVSQSGSEDIYKLGQKDFKVVTHTEKPQFPKYQVKEIKQ